MGWLKCTSYIDSSQVNHMIMYSAYELCLILWLGCIGQQYNGYRLVITIYGPSFSFLEFIFPWYQTSKVLPNYDDDKSYRCLCRYESIVFQMHGCASLGNRRILVLLDSVFPFKGKDRISIPDTLHYLINKHAH